MERITLDPDEIKSAYERIFQDITVEFTIFRVRYHDDEIAIILKGHLLVEYLLDRIIREKCRAPGRILNDSHSYTFSVKLQILYAMGLLPEHLHRNIRRINRLRNKLAHELDFSIHKGDMTIENESGELVGVDTKRKKYPERHYLKTLCMVTLGELAYHMLTRLGVSARYYRDP